MKTAGIMTQDRPLDRLIGEARRQAEALGKSAADSSSSADGAFATASTVEISRADAIPGYQIVREIHRGGQGVVYQAVHESTERDVAIKVLHGGHAAVAPQHGRMDREIEILRDLDHPNIVPVQDIGIVEGRPYLVMPYIVGRPLDEYAADMNLDVRETLELFAEICDAVQAAHLRGVMHRDLKPGNIRVDDDGVPHVLDFGLAKFAEPEGHDPSITQTGHFVGSLPWASPEQAEGRRGVDLRTDVYSLGVILYQLATARLPHDPTGSIREVLNRIALEAPPHPRTLCPDLDEDVDVIIMKCLTKEPQRRYQSAGEVADDVRRFLTQRPIEARRDSFTYAARKFARRNKLPVSLAAALLLVLLTGVPALVISRQQVVIERDRATVSAHDAKNAAHDAKEALDFIASMLSRESLQDDGAVFVEAQNRMLSEAVKLLDAMGDNQPGMQWRVRRAVVRQYAILQDGPAAIAQSDKALEMARRAFGADSDEAANELIEHGATLARWGDVATGEEFIREGSALLLERYGSNDPGVVRARGELAVCARMRGDYAEFDRLMNSNLAFFRAFTGPDSRDLRGALKTYGDELDAQGRDEEAATRKVEALALYEKDPSVSDEHLAHVQHSLAVTLRKLERLAEAEPLAWKSWETRKALFPPEHYNAIYRGVSAGNLGIILARQGCFSEAETWLLEGHDLCERSLWPDSARQQWGGEIAGFLIEFYESWEGAEPGCGYSENAEIWRRKSQPDDPLETNADLNLPDPNEP